MNTKLLAIFFAFLSGVGPQAAAAASGNSSTDTYVATVLSAEGSQAEAFPVGATVVVTTTFNTAATDVIPEPEFGYYTDGLQSLTVHVPDSGFLAQSDAGELSLGNDLEDPTGVVDYLIAYSFEPSVAGEDPVLTSILEFRQMVPPGGVPTMLGSDAIPTEPLAGATLVSFQFWSDDGFTRVDLALSAQPTVGKLVGEYADRIDELVALGRMSQGVATSLIAKLDAIQRASAAGSNGACGPWIGLRNQVGNLPLRTPEEIAVAEELQAMATALEAVLNQCQVA